MSSPAPRKRVSQACQPCGVKKVKCDGSYPTCSPCLAKGVECSYGLSKRRARTSLPGNPSRAPPPPFQGSRSEISRLDSTSHAPSTPQYPAAENQRVISKVSQDVSTRLFLTYFNCIHPLWPLLYKPLYASLEYGTPTDVMPPALVASIFAIASCVDRSNQPATNTIVQKCPEPWEFLEEALNILQEGAAGSNFTNVLRPNITNCQVLAILSLQQHGLAEYSRAAMLCGLASAMAIELHLHRPPESEDPIQSEVHSRLWWNIYILEKMLSIEMGRPILLRYEEADCPYPSADEADEFELMSTNLGKGSIGQFPNTPIKLRSISGLHSTIRLSALLERVSREIYGVAARKVIREDQAVGETKRVELWYALKAWEQEMDASPLKLDMSENLTSVPASVTNYVIMWHGTILLHRPFIARWKSSPAHANQAASPADVCLQAANDICLVLEKYFDRLLGLPCDMVFSIFLAASTLLYHSKTCKNSDEDARRNLKLCVHWLSALGKSWKSAGARHQLLADMYDLPRELQGAQAPPVVPLRAATQFTQQSSQQGYSAPSGRLAPNESLSSQEIPSPEDWTFLKGFGDSSDEFYQLDVQLRGLLDGGFELANMNFAGLPNLGNQSV